MTISMTGPADVHAFVLRASEGDDFPSDLLRAFANHGVTSGWFRGSGVLASVEVRAYAEDLRGHAGTRQLRGPIEAVVLEAAIGQSRGQTTLTLRGVFSRETETGTETIAGEVVSAKVVGVEGIVTSLVGVSFDRALDGRAGVWLFTEGAQAHALAVPRAAESSGGPPRTEAPAFVAPRPVTTPDATKSKIPDRPMKKPADDSDAPLPDAGDTVEHFAFGVCEVVKSEGDRLHVRNEKEQRVREISIEKLKVSLLSDADENGKRRYKLERKL